MIPSQTDSKELHQSSNAVYRSCLDNSRRNLVPWNAMDLVQWNDHDENTHMLLLWLRSGFVLHVWQTPDIVTTLIQWLYSFVEIIPQLLIFRQNVEKEKNNINTRIYIYVINEMKSWTGPHQSSNVRGKNQHTAVVVMTLLTAWFQKRSRFFYKSVFFLKIIPDV